MSTINPPTCCPHCRKVILSPYHTFILEDVQQHPGTTTAEVLARVSKRNKLHPSSVHIRLEYLREHGFLTRAKGFKPGRKRFFEYSAKESAK